MRRKFKGMGGGGRPFKSLLSLPLFALFLLLVPAAGAEPFEVAVTRPWLAMLTSFVGGVNVKVIPFWRWNAEGDLTRVLRRPPSEETRVIALDAADVRDMGLKGDSPNLRLLYSPFPLKEPGAFLSDPAVLPFVAQRVLAALSNWDPGNYPYYQRRLAEFQARLSGSVLAGQQILNGASVLDLTAFSGPLLQAARCKVLRPEKELGGDLKALRAKGVTLVIDAGTPRAVRRALMGQAGVFFFSYPALEQDYPSFLHEQYLALWQQITLKAK